MRIAFIIETGNHLYSGGHMPDSEWAKALAKKLAKKKEAEVITNTAFVMDEQRKQTAGPELWKELREQFRTKCEALNREAGESILTFEVVQSNELQIRKAGTAVLLKGHYNSELTCAVIDSERFQVRIDKNSGLAFLFDEAMNLPVEAERVAESLLETFVTGQ